MTRGQRGPIDEVPARFFPGGDGAYAATVATADHIVGLGSPPGPDGERTDYGEAIALESGEVTPISDPPGEGLRFSVTEVTALETTVIVNGYRCLEDVPDDETCPALDLSYRLDPSTAEWTELTVPEAVASSAMASTRFLQGAGDTAVALFLADSGVTSLARLEGDRWVTVAEVPSSERLTCATDDRMVQVAEASPPPPADGTAPGVDSATFAGRVIDLATGEVTEIGLPPLMTEFSGVGVVLGCNARSAYVATSPWAGVEAGVHRLVGETWEPVPDAFDDPDVMLDSATSGGAAGPAIIAVPYEPGVAAPKTESGTIAFDGDGGLHRLAGNTLDCYVLWRGPTDQALIIGPYVAGEGDEIPPPTVGLRHEVVR